MTARTALSAAVTAPWALWAALRLLGLEPGAPLIGALALTPYVAATAWIPILIALALRRWTVAVAAGLAAVALAVAVTPRAIGGPQAPLTGGRSLSVMTANLRYGNGDPAILMKLALQHHVDLLSLQELTPEAVTRLDRAGARARFPYRLLDPRPGTHGSGLLSRLPLSEKQRPRTTPHAMPQARLAIPNAAPVVVKVVHTIPPLGDDVETWRDELSALPHVMTDGPLTLLIGDFNATLDHHELRSLIRTGYHDAADTAGIGLRGTYRASVRLPLTIAIDHVLIDRRAHITAASIHTLPGSDHRALLASISLPALQR